MKPLPQLLAALLVVSLSMPSVAQTVPGAGPRQGPGFRFYQDVMPGWLPMTAEEHAAYREKMLSLNACGECETFFDEQDAWMTAHVNGTRSGPACTSGQCLSTDASAWPLQRMARRPMQFMGVPGATFGNRK